MNSTAENTTIICAVRNRNAILTDSLRRWLRFDVREVLIVDFRDESCERAAEVVDSMQDPRLRLIETVHEYDFRRSIALNLAFVNATSPFILKLDADYLPEDDFFQENRIGEASFISGFNGQSSEYLTGLLYAAKSQLEQINGYHEDLYYYGREDIDLSERMAVLYERYGFKENSIVHKPHSDTLRTQHCGSCLPKYQREILDRCVLLNRLITIASPWGPERRRVQWSLSELEKNRFLAVRSFY